MVHSVKEKHLFALPDRDSATDLVIKHIKTLFVEKKLRPGDRLPSEYELSEAMGVSRGSIREAMKILKAVGVVEIKQGDGTYVTQPSTRAYFDPLFFELLLTEASVREFMELREIIESGVLRLVVTNASDQELRELTSVHQKMENAVATLQSTFRELTQLDIEFHLTLGRLTHNVLLEKIYRFILDFFAPTIERTYHREKTGANALRLHRDILNALIERDGEKVQSALRESIHEWQRLFREGT
ncbi:MAG: FadR/GntR family transcriptional regulator [Atribacterota bacterium]